MARDMLFGSENLLRGRPVLPQVLKLPARENSLLHCPTLSGYTDTSADCKPPDGSLVDNLAISHSLATALALLESNYISSSGSIEMD